MTSVEFFKSITPKPKSVSIIATNDAFSKLNAQAAAAGCKEIGLEVLDLIQLPEQISDVSSALATIRAKTPDILITTTVDQNSLVIVRQMIATDTNVPLLYQFLGPQLPMYRESLGAKATGVIMQLPWRRGSISRIRSSAAPRPISSYYNKTNTRALSYHTVGASACITTYVEAMRAAGGTDPAKVRNALAATNLITAFGPVKFPRRKATATP